MAWSRKPESFMGASSRVLVFFVREFGDGTKHESKANTMILFPGWMPHGTRVHKGDEPRISLSFNIKLGYK